MPNTQAPVATERRRERRDRQREAAAVPPMQQIVHHVPKYNLLDDAAIQRIHAASMRILSELGIDFYDEEVRAILSAHGVKLVGETAFFTEAQIMEYVAKAPSTFTQQARNPANNVIIGGNHAVFAPVYGPPFVIDLDKGRREAKLE